MLVLSRKSQESIVIGGNEAFARLLKITVLDISGSKVRLGIEVDVDIPVHRKEIWDRIQAEKPPVPAYGPVVIAAGELNGEPDHSQ
jgi:carbon storage regulator